MSMSSPKQDKTMSSSISQDTHTKPASSSFASLSASNPSPSPPPPPFLKWATPPSPFLFHVLVPSYTKSLLSTSNSAAQRKSLFTDAVTGLKPTPKTPKAQIKAKKPQKDSKAAMPFLTTESSLAVLASKTSSAFFDPEIALFARKDTLVRKKRPVQIVKPGTFEKSANALRARLISIDLENEGEGKSEEETDEEFGYFRDDVCSDDFRAEEKGGLEEKEVFEGALNENESFLDKIEKKKEFSVEWWDRELLKIESYGLGEDNINQQMITNYIQHPAPVKKLVHAKPVEPVPLFLTEKERKKARRMKKRARLEIQAERVRLGLEEPPDPRVSLANVMRVLGNTAVADPSAVERQVRAKVEKRRLKHLLHNELRKLAPAERRQKRRRKAAENLADGVAVAVFAVASLKSGRVRFKVDVSAAQLGLTGCALIYVRGKDGAGGRLGGAIVVEGGPNGVRKFKRLMLKRIDWAEENGGDDEGAAGGEDSTDGEDGEDRNRGCCRCVWEGIVPRKAFPRFVTEISHTPTAARRFFRLSKVPQYWDICIKS